MSPERFVKGESERTKVRRDRLHRMLRKRRVAHLTTRGAPSKISTEDLAASALTDLVRARMDRESAASVACLRHTARG
jgi:hypothetical protein